MSRFLARAAVCAFVLALTTQLRAGCGSSSCPIDLHALGVGETRGFSLDLSFQYIDQDQPRIGARRAAIGALAADHDEVRTVNRLASLQLGYGVSDRFQLLAVLPYVGRTHEHIDGETQEPERWALHDAGDAILETRYRLTGSKAPAAGALWLTTGVKMPTGAQHARSTSGEDAEVTMTPGTGSTDAILGLTWRSGLLRDTALEGPLGRTTLIPYFVAAMVRRNGRGRDEYRRGNELQVNAGTEYPLSARLHVLAQVNARHTTKDDPGTTDENREFTGGTYLYASPGVRFLLGGGTSAYALIQLPIYQHVNRLQLTSRANYVAGVHRSF